ncbi:MAG: ABC transporter permease [Ilumatobacteraceae bacterium]
MSPAVAAIARFEVRHRWRGLLALALVGGVLGGVVIGAATLTRRTASAPERLAQAVDPGDVHVRAVDDELAADVIDLPMVSAAWAGHLQVARLDGPTVMYLGVVSESAELSNDSDGSVFQPIVIEGRAPDPAAQDEVALDEDIAAALGIRPGDTLRLSFLTPEEVGQFDTGFGEPDGPTIDAVVSGLLRVPAGVLDGSPVLATPAFTRAHPGLGAATDMYLALRGGAGALAGFSTAVDELVATFPAPPETSDFAPVTIDETRAGTEALIDSSAVLVGGLIAAIVVAIVASLVVSAQAWSRHFGASAMQQRIEAALGLSARDRLAARLVPGAMAALGAGAVALAITLVAAGLEPVGGLADVEPHPGWRVDGTGTAVGIVGVIAATLAVAALGAARAGAERRDARRPRRAGASRLLPRRRGWPLAGAALARPASDRRSAPMAMSLAANALGVAGLVGAIVFTASLDRLTDTPIRYGWNGDLAIVDVNDQILADLESDPRIGAMADIASSQTRISGRDVDAYAYTPVRGDLSWVVTDGNLPVDVHDVMLGPRLALRLDLETGDQLEVGGASLRVVGIGLGPPMNGEQLGSSMLLTPSGIVELAAAGIFREAIVELAPGVSLDEAIADLGQRYELTVRELPAEVGRVDDLGSLPMILGWFLAGLAALALTHALAVTSRRRARDLAVLRAVGSTPIESGLAIVATSMLTVIGGVVVGVPLGWGTARLVWGELARSIGVRGDVLMPPVAFVAAAGAVVAALVITLPFAVAVVRRRPADLLRVE